MIRLEELCRNQRRPLAAYRSGRCLLILSFNSRVGTAHHNLTTVDRWAVPTLHLSVNSIRQSNAIVRKL
jgi:hypothetical protein